MTYFISGMWCSTCAKTVQEKAHQIAGVERAELNYSTKLLFIELKNSADIEDIKNIDQQVQKNVTGIGFGIRKQDKGWLTSFQEDLKKEQERSISNVQVGVVWFLAMWASMISFAGYQSQGLGFSEKYYLAVAASVFGLPAIFIGILPYAKSGVRALKSSRFLTLDLFIFIGGCCAISVSLMNLFFGRAETYADSGAMIIGILLLTKKIESALARKLSQTILYQINQFQDTVEVFKKGIWEKAKVFQIRRNDRLRIKAGETVTFDGILISSQASLNCHLLSGENTLVPYQKGSFIFAGSIAEGDLELLVSEPLGSRKIDEWAETALISGSRSHVTSKFLIKMEESLVAFALLGAIGIALAHFWRGESPTLVVQSFFIGVLIFCPCLFASIIPMSKQMAHLALMKNGIFLHRAEALWKLPEIKNIYLDKTGTLEAVESDFVAMEPADRADLLVLLEELLLKTRHPIIKGLRFESPLSPDFPEQIEKIEEIPGEGIRAGLFDGRSLYLGRPSFVWAEAKMSGVPQDSIYPLLAINQKVVGEVIVKTIFDQQAKDFLQLLLSSKQNFNIQILSGDPDPQAGQSLQALDPRRMTYLGQLTPEQKANLVTEGSLYIGDGLNDTLALSKAAVSCRVGSRVLGFAPVDLQLQIPDLKNIFRIFQYAKKYRRVQMQNIALAFSYNLIALSLAAFGHFSPLGAVLAMAISFSLLTGNSLRLFSFSRRVK